MENLKRFDEDTIVFEKDQRGCKDCHAVKDTRKFCKHHQQMLDRIVRAEVARI